MNTRNYTATVVVDPRGKDGASNELIAKITEIVSASEAQVDKVKELGQHDLAYPPSNNFKSASFMQFEITGSPRSPDLIKEKCRLEKKVDRILIERN